MKKVTIIETLVILAVALPAFAAITCTERTCLETKSIATNTTYAADIIARKIAYINAQLVEIPLEIARDKVRYQDEKEAQVLRLKDERTTLRAQLTKMQTNGANITQNDFDGIVNNEPVEP